MRCIVPHLAHSTNTIPGDGSHRFRGNRQTQPVNSDVANGVLSFGFGAQLSASTVFVIFISIIFASFDLS